MDIRKRTSDIKNGTSRIWTVDLPDRRSPEMFSDKCSAMIGKGSELGVKLPARVSAEPHRRLHSKNFQKSEQAMLLPST